MALARGSLHDYDSRMPALPDPAPLSGEVTERAELLNGAMQLALDGAVGSEVGWIVEFALSWRLGRAGAVDLDEGDLTIEGPAAELIAILDAGTAELDPDTGNVEVDATFEIESATGLALESGMAIRARLEIGAESWNGVLRTSAEAD